MVTRYVGAPVRRVEDRRLVTGSGRYTDDIGIGTGTLEAAFVRSPHAHARILDIDVTGALDVDGVVAIYTYEDLAGAAAEPLPILIPHPALHAGRTAFALANGVVHHVGAAVVMVVAENRYLAEDAAARIAVDYDILPAVVGLDAARAAKNAVHDDVPDNVAAHLVQQVGDVDRAMAAAPHRLDFELEISRSCSMPLEGKAVHARWDPDDRSLRVYSSTQAATSVRAAIAAKLGLPLPKVEVIAPDVGGGFGVKIMHPWPEEILVPMAAIRLRPAGEMDRGPARAFHLLRPRTRPAAAHQRRIRRHRKDSRARRDVLARQRRLHPVRHHLPDRHLHPAARAVQAGRLPGRVLLHVHHHGDRHPVPRRRPAAGRVRDGTHHGPDRRDARPGPDRGARGELHPARRVPVRPGPDLPGRPTADLRLRRLPGPAGDDQGADRLGRLRRAEGAGGAARAGCSASESAATSREPGRDRTRARTSRC